VHCIEWAHLIKWPKDNEMEEFDVDNADHLGWCHREATERAKEFGIEGVTLQLVQGVVKNIIPAIASTNAIVAAACATEVLKTITMCSAGMDNYMMFMGGEGIYTHTVKYERDECCPVCSPGIFLTVQSSVTLGDLIKRISVHPKALGKVERPSVSHGTDNLYMQGPLEEATRPNLSKTLGDLLGGTGQKALAVNDKRLPRTLRVTLSVVP